MSDEVYNHRHLDDVKRIRLAILNMTGQAISLREAAGIWEEFSDRYAAGWLFVPENDHDIWSDIRIIAKPILEKDRLVAVMDTMVSGENYTKITTALQEENAAANKRIEELTTKNLKLLNENNDLWDKVNNPKMKAG